MRDNRGMLTAKNMNATVTFDGRAVTIKRSVLAGNAEKVIPVGSITAVQWKRPGLTNGYIEFTVAGGRESHKRGADHGNENQVLLRMGGPTKDFEAIRDAVREVIAQGGAASAPPAPDVADQLQKLAALRDQGVLSDVEFDAKKAELLSRM